MSDAVGPVPRRLWMLWIQGLERAPRLVRACVDSWRRWNPGWTIEVLDGTRLARVLPEALGRRVARGSMAPEVVADLVRVNLLHRHGGVWADATCLCRKPLDAWLPGVAHEGFFAFAAPGPDRLLASWLLAAAPGHPLVARWRALANAYWEDAPPRTPAWLPPELVRRPELAARRGDRMAWFEHAPPGGEGRYPYFWLHYLFERALLDPALATRWDAVPKLDADGPHRPQRLGLDRPVEAAMKRVLRDEDAPLHKLTIKKALDVDDPRTLVGWCVEAARGRAG